MSALKSLLSSYLLFDVAAGLLFYGSFANDAEFQRKAAAGIQELLDLGYRGPGAANPLRIYELKSEGEASGRHGGGWRPGSIAVRANPVSGTAAVFLRHELFHQLNYLTCTKRFAIWAEEAAAMAFSGESETAHEGELKDLEHLRKGVESGGPLDSRAYKTLLGLVKTYGWPRTPCAISEDIAELIETDKAKEARFDFVVLSALSGRVLESSGDTEAKASPGSLLKIPYAASLQNADTAALGEELLRSDTEALLARRSAVAGQSTKLIYSGVRQPPPIPETGDIQKWRCLLGERDEKSGEPLALSLHELGSIIRTSLLYKTAYFERLKDQGKPGSTLERANPKGLELLRKLKALAKTGTVSDARGNPLMGHLMVAWPAQDPRLIALFRKGGVRGAAVLDGAVPVLFRWAAHPFGNKAGVRVELMSLLKEEDKEVSSDCPPFSVNNDASRLTSTCGAFLLKTAAPRARKERTVYGVLEQGGERLVLTTDPESYADGVVEAEGDTLPPEARKALRAVAVWNGVHGSARHSDTHSLCDTTHCMVYLGTKKITSERTSSGLLALLNERARAARLGWLSFSKGGREPWEKKITGASLASAVHEAQVIEIQRERRRNGEVIFHLYYPGNEETFSCEALRKVLQLPSCPQRAVREGDDFRFAGTGAGHGLGLDITWAAAKAQSGWTAEEILKESY